MKKLEAAPTSTQNGMRDVPVTPLVIESVRLKQGWATVMTCVPVLLEAERKNASAAFKGDGGSGSHRLGAVFAVHLVLHLWARVRDRARFAHHASEEGSMVSSARKSARRPRRPAPECSRLF